MKVNFHTHTNHSDGSVDPYRMVEIMKENHFDFIALTDHDTTSGISEAARACAGLGLGFFTGVEITSFLDESLGLYDDSYKVHIVGLGIDEFKVSNDLKKTEEKKIEYHRSLLSSLISSEELEQLDIDISNRVSCVEALVFQNAVDSIDHGMSLFKVSPYAMSIMDSIACIHDAGGIAIWAHPFILPKNGGRKIFSHEVECIYKYMRKLGVDGLEAYYQTFSENEQKFLEELSDKYGGFRSTGTDFHGDSDNEYDLLENIGKYDDRLLKMLAN